MLGIKRWIRQTGLWLKRAYILVGGEKNKQLNIIIAMILIVMIK
jgi:hypothetical protein